jgi:hypothetical protein
MISTVASGLKTKFIQGWPSAQGADTMASSADTSAAPASPAARAFMRPLGGAAADRAASSARSFFSRSRGSSLGGDLVELHLGDEAAGHAGHRVAALLAPAQRAHHQRAARARDAHVHQPALFFQPLGRHLFVLAAKGQQALR